MTRPEWLPPVMLGPAGWSLFLDLDGTLCPLVARPEQVDLSHAQRRMLRRLNERLDGALCVVSGRGLVDLQRILRDVPIRLIAAHGAETPDFASAEVGPASALLRRLHAPLLRLAAAHDGVWIEDKGHALALHYRQRPELGEPLDHEVRALAADAAELRVMHGNHVIELLPRAISKGQALTRAMQHPAFCGRTPVAVGDDVTDEDAFAAAQALHGFGVHVGRRPDTIARFRLPCVVVANTWLDVLADAPPPSTTVFDDDGRALSGTPG